MSELTLTDRKQLEAEYWKVSPTSPTVHQCCEDGCRDEITRKVTGYEMCEGHAIRHILAKMGEADEYWLGVYMDDIIKLDWVAEVTL